MGNLLECISQSDNILLTTMKRWYTKITNPQTMVQCKRQGVKKVYLLLTPQYNNLGDHAIAWSSFDFLRKRYSDALVVEITSNFYKNYRKEFHACVTPEDVLFVIGGGFMGDLWENLDTLTRDIVKSFPDNKIIFLPQTIYFQSAENIPKAKAIYQSHSNLHVIARERQTYDLCKEILQLEHCYLLPDIVTILDCDISCEKKNLVGLCLREDHEKGNVNISKEAIMQMFGEKNICEITTLISNSFISTSQRKEYVTNKIKEIGACKMLITNRLHAMLFAYITGTPCIAIDNVSKKVSGTYQWIKDCGYVKLYDGKIDFTCFMASEMDDKLISNNTMIFDNIKMLYEDVFKQIDS